MNALLDYTDPGNAATDALRAPIRLLRRGACRHVTDNEASG